MRKLLASLVALIAAITPLASVADIGNVSASGTFSSTGPSRVLLLSGQSTCQITLRGAATGVTIVPQTTGDLSNNASAYWTTASQINSGTITYAGTTATYTGNVAVTGLTGFRFLVTAISTGTVSYTEVCSAGLGAVGGGGGGGGSVLVSNTTTQPVPISGSTGLIQQDASGNTKVTLGTALPTGSNAIGGVTQSGTWNVGQTGTWSVGQSGTWNVGLTAGTNNIGSITPPQGSTPTVPSTTASGFTAHGQFNTTLPTLTNGQSAPFQQDSAGRMIVSGSFSATPPSYGPYTGTLQNLNDAVTTPIMSGAGSCTIYVPAGLTGGTVTFQGSQNGTNYVALLGQSTGTANAYQSTVGSGGGTFTVNAAGLQYVRAIVTTGGSAAVSASVYCSGAPFQWASFQIAGTNGSITNNTPGDALSPGSSLGTNAYVGVFNGTSWDRLRTDSTAAVSTNKGIPLVNTGNNTATATITSGTTGLSSFAAHRVYGLLVTVTTTTQETCYDNASAASGNIVLIVPANTATGSIVTTPVPGGAWLANGLTCSDASGSPGLTVFYGV